MTLYVLDAGELIQLESNSRHAWARLRAARDKSEVLVVPTAVVGQVWRGTLRQARLNQALKECKEIPLDKKTARAAGVLCGKADTSDVIDAVVAIIAHSYVKLDDVAVLTSDPDDIRALLEALNSNARVASV